MKDARQVALLHTLERECGNQSSAYATTVFGRQNLNRVLGRGVGLLGPVENLLESLRSTRLEVRVLVEDGAIGTNVAGLDVLLLANGSDTAGRETGGASADEFGEAADKLELGRSDLNVQLVGKQVQSLL